MHPLIPEWISVSEQIIWMNDSMIQHSGCIQNRILSYYIEGEKYYASQVACPNSQYSSVSETNQRTYYYKHIQNI